MTDNTQKLKAEFREITADTLDDILRLSLTLSPEHRNMVASNAVSIAEAYFEPHAWFRGIYAGDTAVGFIMVDKSGLVPDETDDEKPISFPGWFLWRFMMADQEQGKGYGKQSLDILVDMMRKEGLQELRTSCGRGPGSPLGFYEKYGFVQTGRIIYEETELILNLL